MPRTSAASGSRSTSFRAGTVAALPEAESVARNFAELIREARLTELPITVEQALAAGALPGPHRDPFDRMLIAQSRLERVPVVSGDRVFSEYGVEVVW
jgi:PIN domain nuclease of toxin-antitoxin system